MTFIVSHDTLQSYTKPKSQRNCGLFCICCTSHACIHQNVFKNIMPSHLRIAKNISFNRQSLGLEETTNFIEVGCLLKTKCMTTYLYSACDIHSYTWKDTSILSNV